MVVPFLMNNINSCHFESRTKTGSWLMLGKNKCHFDWSEAEGVPKASPWENLIVNFIKRFLAGLEMTNEEAIVAHLH